MSLSAGAQLGPYEILSLLGAGGMGEVYRARDTKLERDVALKVLPEGFFEDPDRVERFKREAKLLAALNHPNIATIHAFEEVSGRHFLVMEFVDGQALGKLIRSGDLTLRTSLAIARDIASALAAAHAKGVVHRDLKPGNVMVSKEGTVKLLDFGLAKALLDEVSSSKLSLSPTESVGTAEGIVLGTAAYMSPEQARGEKVDARTDVWAFGVVLFEMLTGKRLFRGPSTADMLAAVLREPIDLGQLPSSTPLPARHVLDRCLERDLGKRLSEIGKAKQELERASAQAGAKQLRRRSAGAVLAVVLAAAAAVVLFAARGPWRWTRRQKMPAAPAETRHTQLTFTGDVENVALSPDGRTIAYAAGDQDRKVRVLVRDLGAGQPVQVWEGASVWDMRWTPDGLYVLVSGRQFAGQDPSIQLVPRLGGATRLVPATPSSIGSLAVSPDGTRVATANAISGGVEIVSIESGKREHIPLPDAQYTWALDWSPVSNRLSVFSYDKNNHPNVSVVLPDGKGLRSVYTGLERLTGGCWSQSEDVLYLERLRDESIDLLRLSTADGDAALPVVLLSALPSAYRCQISADGQRLIHTRVNSEANLSHVDLEARGGAPVGLTHGTWKLEIPRVSPDGRWISATRGKEIVRFPIGGGEPVVLTSGHYASWSPDGRRLAFASDRGGKWRPWVAGADGQQAREIPGADALADQDVRWFSDERLAWHTPDDRDYRIRDLKSGVEESLVKDPSAGFVFFPCLSPKGDQIAVFWNRTPGFKAGLWVISWPARAERLVAPDLMPFGWSADGKWIYAFNQKDDAIVRAASESGKVETIARRAPGAPSFTSCGLTPDTRSAVCAETTYKTDVWMIEHFDPLVARPKR